MYERFTDRTRKVMQLANQGAQRFNHEYVGTEHVLLGLVDLRKIRLEVEKIVEPEGRIGRCGQRSENSGSPGRSSNTQSKRLATSTTIRWEPSTCCWACCADRKALPSRC